jgi:AcrR family transcriptional regulator
MEKVKRKEREFNLRRAEILETAEKIFAEKGFYNTTVAEIASASGFAVGTIYQFFKSKDELYSAMLTEKLNVMYEEIRNAVGQEAGLLKKIEVLAATSFRFVENNTAFCNIFVRGDHLSPSEGSKALRERMKRDYVEYVSSIEEVIREGIRNGELKKMDPHMMAATLLGIINSCAFRWLSASKEGNLETDIPFVLDIFLKGAMQDAH